MNDFGVTVPERITPLTETYRAALEAFSRRLRVAVPGIIQEFDPNKQTVTVRPAITESVVLDGKAQPIPLPLLYDVPICLPRAGGYVLTMPIQQGDECLIIFGDVCIDSWWQSGGQQDQFEQRRHDLSDGFAVLAPWSQPRVVANYNMGATELRTDNGQTKVTVEPGKITLTSQNVTVNASSNATIQGQTVNITGTSGVTINGNAQTQIDNKSFLLHRHSGVSSGGSTSGPVF